MPESEGAFGRLTLFFLYRQKYDGQYRYGYRRYGYRYYYLFQSRRVVVRGFFRRFDVGSRRMSVRRFRDLRRNAGRRFRV